MAANFKSASEAARSLGVSPSTYIHHENGTRDFDEVAAALYARRYHVTVSWLLLGDGEMETPELAEQRAEEIEAMKKEEMEDREARASVDPEIREKLRENSQRRAEQQALETLKSMTLLPEISPFFKKEDNVLSRGWRRYVGLEEKVTHQIVATWGIPAKHLQYEIGASSGTIIFPVTGDANVPTLMHGDLVFVDTAIDDVIADGLYLVADKIGYPQVRRLKSNLVAQPPSVTISADASPEQRQVVEISSISIVGKVVARLSRM
ncbi:hypothetical protein [Rhizobium sp. YTU87027]|uniref:LexA family transcriptional regulator n=1 Tax=Rhizobium sp. YTU87027 TaxID=3417741 RepID=UPI003D68BE0B